jgi:hypothetical protein
MVLRASLPLGLVALALIVPLAVAARSAPAGLDLHSKDKCKNICVMARVTCEDKCKAEPKHKQPKCYLKCPKKEAACKDTCATAINGQKPQREIDREDRVHQRGLDRPGQAPAMNPPNVPAIPPGGIGG